MAGQTKETDSTDAPMDVERDASPAFRAEIYSLSDPKNSELFSKAFEPKSAENLALPILGFADSDKTKNKTEVPAPEKNDLLDMLDKEPPSLGRDGKPVDDSRFKDWQKGVIESMTDAERKNMGDLATAVKNGDYSKLDEIVKQFKDNPERLGDLLQVLGNYFQKAGLGSDKGYSMALGYNDKRGTFSLQIPGKPFHYVRTDGSDPHSPL